MTTHEVIDLVEHGRDVVEISETAYRPIAAVVAIHRHEIAFKGDDHSAAHFLAAVQLGRHWVDFQSFFLGVDVVEHGHTLSFFQIHGLGNVAQRLGNRHVARVGGINQLPDFLERIHETEL